MWRKRVFICVLLALCLIAFANIVNSQKKEVTVYLDDEVITLTTWKKTVGDVLEKLNYDRHPRDIIEPTEDGLLTQNMEIIITSAKAVIVLADGIDYVLFTAEEEVEKILAQGQIVLNPQDRVDFSEGKFAKEIIVQRVEVKEEIIQVKVDFDTKTREDGNLTKGRTQVLEEGEKGLLEKFYQVTYVDGIEKDRELVKEEMKKEPKEKLVAVGTKEEPVQVASRSGARVVSTQEGTASWYGNELKGSPTSSGEPFDPSGLTAAHPEYFNFSSHPVFAKVTFLQTGKSVTVRINDHFPGTGGRIIDLSRAAAEAIGLRPHGIGTVRVELLK